MATSQSAQAQASGTRERILSAAIDLFGEQGYAGTSVRDISDRLGVTKAALYYHFPSKETILDALIDPFLGEIDRLVQFVRSSPAPPVLMIFEWLADAMAGAGAMLFAFWNDPSVIQRRIGENGRYDVLDQWEEIVRAVAGPDATELGLLRARCAIGCIKSGVFDSAISRNLALGSRPADAGGTAGTQPASVVAEPGVGGGSGSGGAGSGGSGGDGCFMAECGPARPTSTLLSEQERRVVVAAALAAFHS